MYYLFPYSDCGSLESNFSAVIKTASFNLCDRKKSQPVLGNRVRVNSVKMQSRSPVRIASVMSAVTLSLNPQVLTSPSVKNGRRNIGPLQSILKSKTYTRVFMLIHNVCVCATGERGMLDNLNVWFK